MPSRQSYSISLLKEKDLQLRVAVIQILKFVHTVAICNFRASLAIVQCSSTKLNHF